MNLGLVLALAFGIGVVAGLRSLTAPAVVAWLRIWLGSIFLALTWLSWPQPGWLVSSLLAH